MERNARIEEVARRLWDAAGRPEGRSLEFWLRAEKLVPILRYFEVLPEE